MATDLPATHPGETRALGMSDPSSRLSNITKSDSTTYDPMPRGLYVGTAGDVVLEAHALDGTLATVTFKAVPAGTVLPVRYTKVKAASTASDFVAMW